MKNHTILLDGNQAISYGAKLARPQVVPIYPITPQTSIAEKITEFHFNGEINIELITVESEHSAMSAAVSAALTGVRVFTATSSQGLLLMHEMLHYAAGARAPIVMANVNRTISSPWGFWPDQTDSLSQRDTGWIQYYSESAQESLDTVLQAYRVAEQVMLPVMVVHEAFYVSHSLEPVSIPSQELVDAYLAPYSPEIYLDPAIGSSWGNVVDQEMYCRHRYDMDQAMVKAITVAQSADQEWQELTGRNWGIVESYRLEGAQVALVTFGSISGTAREAVDQMRESGLAIGLLKIRLFRPLPVEAIKQHLSGIPQVIVLERNYSPGTGGILHQELKAALYGINNLQAVYGALTGVGGLNVSVGTIIGVVRDILQTRPQADHIWVR